MFLDENKVLLSEQIPKIVVKTLSERLKRIVGGMFQSPDPKLEFVDHAFMRVYDPEETTV